MWFSIKNQHVALRIFAKPNAHKTTLIAVNDDALQIALQARAQDGEANKELISYLSKLLEIPKSTIHLQRGEASRHKSVVLPLTPSLQRFLDDPTPFLKK